MWKFSLIHNIKGEEIEEENIVFIGITLSYTTVSPIGQDFTIKLRVKSSPNNIEFVIDTGAQVTCMSKRCVFQMLINRVVPSDRVLVDLDKNVIKTVDMLTVEWTYASHLEQIKVYILHDGRCNILGKPEI